MDHPNVGQVGTPTLVRLGGGRCRAFAEGPQRGLEPQRRSGFGVLGVRRPSTWVGLDPTSVRLVEGLNVGRDGSGRRGTMAAMLDAQARLPSPIPGILIASVVI